nr:uncharacterized protein CTRU02_15802 [Colletotrichum truncatum]XP_036584325.1 uncharacterized protein CTRU02_05400 [Colletotrichum truncatum]XP_036584571.1 uncharacterized protein CTRU02_05646 [Colletotrichum truncatum]KAF6780650.1 hypothetical protein CTRU02_15802 [Colletotrichum truncatum]KAF6793843.1 hypothetical protein CTRU02_05400 [Colletotrichum truncatum]KAF6794089.1 hypothetical protein CTRU02_05646 [Colletotrichum truncatum]
MAFVKMQDAAPKPELDPFASLKPPPPSVQSEKGKPPRLRGPGPRKRNNRNVSQSITPGATFSWVTNGKLVMELVNGRTAYYFMSHDGHVIGVYPGVWSCPPVFQW